MRPSTVLALQRTAGNRAVSRMLSGSRFDDMYEEEADRPAAQVMGIQQSFAAPPVTVPDTAVGGLSDAMEELSFAHDERVRRRRP
jgi:hypothetical protein